MTDKDNDLDNLLGDGPTSSPASAAGDTQRRVYALPVELVERIVEFQREKGLPSEVEAARRLLDDALKSRDDLDRVVNRFLGKLRQMRIASEVAKDVLVGHPLVKSMSFEPDTVRFEMKDGMCAQISDRGAVSIWVAHSKASWTWKRKNKEDPYGAGYSETDEIPF